MHGHGSKGGVYGRLIGSWLNRKRPVGRVYSPHGGSLHYDESSLEGRFYFKVERVFERMTDAIVHVSTYEAETYRRKVGVPRCEAIVIRNGLRPDEYVPVVPNADARDLLYLGMLRSLKGIDVFLDALARLKAAHGRTATAHVIGQTDDLAAYEAMARRLGIADEVAFHLPKPTREAFAMARALVVPSRAESMPYVVLEAVAGGLPLVATRVGGIRGDLRTARRRARDAGRCRRARGRDCAHARRSGPRRDRRAGTARMADAALQHRRDAGAGRQALPHDPRPQGNARHADA